MKRCEGLSGKPSPGEELRPCPYDASPGEDFCYLHGKVKAGLVTDLSWHPFAPKATAAVGAEGQADRLRREWDLV